MTFTFKLAKRIAHSRPVAPRLLAAMLLLAGCADSLGTSPSDPSLPDTAAASNAVASVTITPGTASGSVGQTAQFTAVARNAAGTLLSGRTVTWSTGNNAVVSVTATGLATAIGGGSTTINATIGGVVGRANVSVTGAVISIASVVVTPGTAAGAVGDRAQFVAAVKDATGAVLNSVKVVWSSTNAAVVTVDTAGYATAVGGGTAEIVATAGNVTGRAAVTVTGPAATTVASVTVAPGTAGGSVGQSAQFTATVKDAAGNVLTGQSVTWTTSDPAVVTVNATGYATAVGGGSALITATAGGQSGQAAVTVTGSTIPTGTLASIRVSPGTVSVAAGTSAQLSAAPLDAGGLALTGVALTWASSAPAVASVNASGLVTALTTGNATITATSAGITGSAAITVTSGTTPPPPPPSGAEPTYQAGQSLIWKDTFDGVTSDAQVLANYTTLNPQFIHEDVGAGLGGGGALRFDWQASTGCTDQSRLIEQGITPTREIYVTYSVRYTPNFQYDWRNYSGCTGNAKKLFFLYSVSGSRFDFISENHWLGMGSDYDHPLFNQNQGGTISDEQLGDGNWHRITIHVLQSSTPTATDGIIEGWIDGVQRWSYRNVASNASGGWNYFHFPSTFNQGSPATQSEWVDDLVVWKP